MFDDIITKENEEEFYEKIRVDNEVSVVNSLKPLSPFKIARARKALGDRRRVEADRHRGQRDGKRHPKRDEKAYSFWSISQATPSTSKIITRGVDDYLDEIEAENAEAEAQAEAEAYKEDYIHSLKEERYEALMKAIYNLERVFELDKAIAGLED